MPDQAETQDEGACAPNAAIDSIGGCQFQPNRTGLVFDPVMLEFHCQWDEKYPEYPDRIRKPFERCQFYGLTEKCVKIPGRPSTDEELELCHTSRVVQMLGESEKMNEVELMGLSSKYDSVYFHPSSNKAVRYATGSSIELMDNIMSGSVQNGFAIIRPPGHHAMHDEPNGYCYFNHAAVVAKVAIEKHKLERILIVDWDVHHGQGTQLQFYDDPRVLYFSSHRYDYGEFWPNLRESDFDYIGNGAGRGYNINVPLNKTGFGHEEFLAAFFNLLLPVAYEFCPQLIIVSCGFDSAIGDEKGAMRVTPAGYAHFINALSCLSNSKLCVLLEGGYCIKSLSEGVALTLRALLGYPTPRIDDLRQPDPIFVETLRNLVSVLRPYWKCLQNLNDEDASIKLSDYLKKWDVENRENRGIAFYDLNNKPESFPLATYSNLPDEVNQLLDKEIDKLIASTSLHVPERRSFVSFSDTNLADLLDTKLLDKCARFIGGDEVNGFKQALESLDCKKTMNGLVLTRENEVFSLLKAAQEINAENLIALKKTLFIDMYSNSTALKNQLGETCSSNPDDLLISFNQNETQDLTSNKITIQLDEPIQDIDYLTAFWRVLIPIAYQFNPDLVFLFVDAKTSVSPNGLGQITRILNSLANGNVVVALQTSSNADDESKLKADKCLSILLGSPCDQLEKMVPSEKLQKKIKDQILALKAKWSCFQFNDRLPTDDSRD